MTTTAKWVADLMEGMISPIDGLLSSRAIVVQTEYISANIKRVRFRGNFSRMNFQIGYAVIIRVSPNDFRNYTISFHDVENNIVEIIFCLHGDAPGSNFARLLKKDDKVLISLPRGAKQYDPKMKRQLVFGDETSLGFACAFHPLLKQNAHEYLFYFELDKKNEDVPGILELENYMVLPKGTTFKDEQLMKDLPVLKNQDWENANYILTGNVKSVQAFRRVLRNGNIKGKILAKGFWLEGKTGL